MKRSSKSLSSITLMTLMLFTASEAFVPQFVFAEPISGMIQAVTPLGDGRYQLTVQGAEGETFFITAATQIEGVVPAHDVKQGEKIIFPGARPGGGKGGVNGFKGLKDPLANMSDELKKKLNLPNIPEIPSVPDVPQIPELPDMSEIPKREDLEKAGVGPGAGAGAGPGAPAGGGGGKKVEHEVEPLPPPEEMLGPKSPVLTSPDSGASSGSPRTVVETRVTEGGIEIDLEGEEDSFLLPPDAPVKKILMASELQANMRVSFSVMELEGQKVVEKLQVV